ncbi:hypothetical protein ACFSZS_19290 [Seohaeicola zhoushanensis]
MIGHEGDFVLAFPAPAAAPTLLLIVADREIASALLPLGETLDLVDREAFLIEVKVTDPAREAGEANLPGVIPLDERGIRRFNRSCRCCTGRAGERRGNYCDNCSSHSIAPYWLQV